MPKFAYYIFTQHAFDRMKQQHIDKKDCIELLNTGERVKGTSHDKKEGVFYIQNKNWLFVLKELKYDPAKGCLLRVITVTDRNVGPKSYKGIRQSELQNMYLT